MKPTPRRDPAIDRSFAARMRAVAAEFFLAIAGVLGYCALTSYIDAQDAKVEAEEARRDAVQIYAIAKELRTELALRDASGNCSRIFYLVEAPDVKVAGEKLAQAGLQIADAANHALYPEPLPPLRIK